MTTPALALKELVANLNRQQKKTHELLSNLGFALRSFKNLNQFLELIPLMITRVTDADAGAIILFKKNGQLQIQQFHCQGHAGCEDLRQGIELAIRSTLDSNPDREVDFDPHLWDNLESKFERDLRCKIKFFSTPIVLHSGERGRLYIFSKNSNYEWTPDRQKLLQLVADQTAVAIANDELTVELRKKERLDRELEIGAEIQERLLPKQFPKIPGLEFAACNLTANRVGGDYYDFIPTNDDRLTQGEVEPKRRDRDDNSPPHKWSIVIGDVMGKGVPAGLIMTMTRGMLRAEVLNGHSPSQILQHLNQVMYADLENSSRFVTLFYSEYSTIDRTLTYSNAAHNPPLYWQAATHQISRLDTRGMLVGLDPDSKYEEGQTKLYPGDTIIYYTDGFTDATNPDGERFDEENLARAFQQACEEELSASGILDRLIAIIHDFVGSDRDREDDMTMVVMKLTSEISK
jgi:sigma-B regulation protein RsbU (phosphoserine phosphatase)